MCKYLAPPCTIKIDNTSTIALLQSSKFHRRSKHISLKELFIKDHFEKKEIFLEYVPSERQLADILTKSLNGPRLQELKQQTGLKAIKDERSAHHVGVRHGNGN